MAKVQKKDNIFKFEIYYIYYILFMIRKTQIHFILKIIFTENFI